MAGPGTISRAADCTLFTQGGLGHAVAQRRRSTTRTRSSSTGSWRATTTRACSSASPTRATDPNVAINRGYEIQIDATDDPDSTTGAIYNFQAANAAARDAVLNPPGEWNSYELRVEGKRIRVYLNGALINDFTSTAPERMVTPSFIGLQNHGNGDDVWFRNVQIKNLRRGAAGDVGGAGSGPAGPGGTYDGPVGVKLSAAGGAAFTEYRVNTNGEEGEWVRADNTAGADPFETAFTVTAEGEHVVEYRSTRRRRQRGGRAVGRVHDRGGGATDPDAPIVQAFADPTSGEAPLDVQFSATAIDPQGGRLIYRWEFSEGGSALQPEPAAHATTSRARTRRP